MSYIGVEILAFQNATLCVVTLCVTLCDVCDSDSVCGNSVCVCRSQIGVTLLIEAKPPLSSTCGPYG